MKFFPAATEHHQPASAPGHRPQNPAPQGRPSTVRVQNDQWQTTVYDYGARCSRGLPSWDENAAVMENLSGLLQQIGFQLSGLARLQSKTNKDGTAPQDKNERNSKVPEALMPICPTPLPPFIMQSFSILDSPANGFKFI
jgi:hypothetical protein